MFQFYTIKSKFVNVRNSEVRAKQTVIFYVTKNDQHVGYENISFGFYFGGNSKACFEEGHLRSIRCTAISVPIPVTARSKTWICGRSPARTAGSNPARAWMSVLCQCSVLLGVSL